MKKVLGILLMITWANTSLAVTESGIAQVSGEEAQILLVEATGLPLYIFTPDGPDQSNCSGGCASTWPPAVLTAEEADNLEEPFGAIERASGDLQLTHNQRPLYTFIGDQPPEEGEITIAKGEALQNVWFVIEVE